MDGPVMYGWPHLDNSSIFEDPHRLCLSSSTFLDFIRFFDVFRLRSTLEFEVCSLATADNIPPRYSFFFPYLTSKGGIPLQLSLLVATQYDAYLCFFNPRPTNAGRDMGDGAVVFVLLDQLYRVIEITIVCLRYLYV